MRRDDVGQDGGGGDGIRGRRRRRDRGVHDEDGEGELVLGGRQHRDRLLVVDRAVHSAAAAVQAREGRQVEVGGAVHVPADGGERVPDLQELSRNVFGRPAEAPIQSSSEKCSENRSEKCSELPM